VQVPVACFSSLVLTFFKHFVCLVSFYYFLGFFFKVNSGVFLHSRVATLRQVTAKSYLQHARATREELWRWSLNESYNTIRLDTAPQQVDVPETAVKSFTSCFYCWLVIASGEVSFYFITQQSLLIKTKIARSGITPFIPVIKKRFISPQPRLISPIFEHICLYLGEKAS